MICVGKKNHIQPDSLEAHIRFHKQWLDMLQQTQLQVFSLGVT